MAGDTGGATLVTSLHHFSDETLVDFLPHSDGMWKNTEVMVGRNPLPFAVSFLLLKT
jgi:hypothetical protein